MAFVKKRLHMHGWGNNKCAPSMSNSFLFLKKNRNKSPKSVTIVVFLLHKYFGSFAQTVMWYSSSHI